MVDWLGQAKGLVMPAAYILVITGFMVTFSSLYRKREAAQAASLEPWFPPHLARNIYLSLLHLEQNEPGKEKPVTVPDSILKAALLRRAVEDIHRILALRSSKSALQILIQRGSVGDDLWQRFQRAEKELQAELEDVVSEANALAPNWGQSIFQSANEMAANAKLKDRIAEVQNTITDEKKWYAKKRDASVKELLAGSTSSYSASSSSSGEEEEADNAPDDEAAKRASASGSSDGDGVLVQAPDNETKSTGQQIKAAEQKAAAQSGVEGAAVAAQGGGQGSAGAVGGSGGGKNKKRRGKGKK